MIFQRLHYLQLFEQNILAAYIDQLHVGLYMLPFFLDQIDQIPGGNCPGGGGGGDCPGGGAIVRGAIVQGTIVRGAIVRGPIVWGGNCPRTLLVYSNYNTYCFDHATKLLYCDTIKTHIEININRLN